MMEEGTGKMEESVNQNREEIFSEAVRAGKRTYFFDVKATRRNDYYLTITESKKRFGKDGQSFYEKHKVFLYKEDFDKFLDGLQNVIDYIKENQPEMLAREDVSDELETEMAESFTNVEFEDLDEGKV
jgi:hypothetical protein